MDKKHIKKINMILSLALIVIIISYSIFNVFFINLQKKEIEKATEELDLLNTLEQYQSSTIYELYNPSYKDAVDFMNDSKSKNISYILNKAENNNINTALVQIIMSEKLFMYTLIGFNTTDKKMVYFEPDTTYEVIPKIGKNYIDCVINQPYNTNIFNDTIRDILIVW